MCNSLLCGNTYTDSLALAFVQLSMEKMSGGLHVKKMEHVGNKMYLKKKIYTSLQSSHPHALQQRQVGLDDDHDQILACQKIRSE